MWQGCQLLSSFHLTPSFSAGIHLLLGEDVQKLNRGCLKQRHSKSPRTLKQSLLQSTNCLIQCTDFRFPMAFYQQTLTLVKKCYYFLSLSLGTRISTATNSTRPVHLEESISQQSRKRYTIKTLVGLSYGLAFSCGLAYPFVVDLA